MLRAGDILLGDRAYCTYAHLALLQLQGVFGCFRLHQRRKRTLGRQRWKRENKAPAWMGARQFQSLPPWLEVRIIRYAIEQQGFRTKEVCLATTLLDEQAWPDEKLRELYGRRWHIETCFNHLKTTMKMNVLKCQSENGVRKELAVYLLVYNLVRLAMLKAAERQQASVRRISFVDALRYLCCRMLGLRGVETLLINPYRPGRREPRVIRRRVNEYKLMTLPREELKRRGIWADKR
jgi:Transposase DDE domain